jgi:hypothetical protein
MIRNTKSFTLAATIIGVSLVAAACSSNNPFRKETSKRLASAAFMIEREVEAGPFSLTVYERMHERHKPAHIYIESDGSLNDLPDVFMGTGTAWRQNDPQNPVALHIATRDKADNIAYLARPCQYSGLIDPEAECDAKYFTNEAYSGEVLAAYNQALDKIKRRYDLTGFHLVGFEGGGTIAAILAATRTDILSLRTVAANLDHAQYTAHNQMPPYSDSLNAIDFAPKLANMPQVHFIGGQDEKVPPAILHSFVQAIGPTNCVQYEFVQEAGHKEGWVDKWPELLSLPPTCRGPVVETEMTFDPLPVYEISPERPEKP